jgi:ribose transport system substrate-binding protein
MKAGTIARIVAIAVAGGVFGACGGDAGGSAAAADGSREGRISIAVIAKSSNNPVFLAARTGAEAAARDLSEEYGISVEIMWLTPPTEDGQVQAQRIHQAVNAGADAILISASDAAKVAGAINDAVARGVEVMTFDSDVPQSRRFAYYGIDDVQVGRNLMAELARLTHGQATVAILAGNQNAPNLQRRAQGVREEAARHPGVRIAGTFHHIETPQDAAGEVIRVNNAYPQVDAWAFVGGWPLFTQALLTDIDPAHTKVVSVDGLPPQLPYVERGIVPVLLAQPVYLWGYVGVQTIVEKLHLGREVPEIIPMEPVKVSRENLGEWARQLSAWGFTDVPAAYLELGD